MHALRAHCTAGKLGVSGPAAAAVQQRRARPNARLCPAVQLNAPPLPLSLPCRTVETLMFLVEQAHWFYEVRPGCAGAQRLRCAVAWAAR